MHVPLLESQLKQHFCPALQRHFVCFPSIAVAAHAVLVAFFCAWASNPAAATSVIANAHPNTAIHLVIAVPSRYFSTHKTAGLLMRKVERPAAHPRWELTHANTERTTTPSEVEPNHLRLHAGAQHCSLLSRHSATTIDGASFSGTVTLLEQ
jgi:hypothetical protein